MKKIMLVVFVVLRSVVSVRMYFASRWTRWWTGRGHFHGPGQR